MRFHETSIPGVMIVETDFARDERGAFGRLWCSGEFARAGFGAGLSQLSLSTNARAGTVRGLHYAVPPHEETKLVRCVRGAIFDVAVDLRQGPTRGAYIAVELTYANGKSLLIPPGVAHGFQTLVDESDVLYALDVPYEPASGRALRFDDPALGIAWPLPVTALSERDRVAASFAPPKT